MNINHEELIKKILMFWKENEGKDFSAADLRKVFNHYELITILEGEELFQLVDHSIIYRFQSLIREVENMFTLEEAEELFERYNLSLYVLKSLGDEKLLTLISDENYDLSHLISIALISDEAKLKAAKKVKDPYLKTDFIRAIDSDSLKEQHLKDVPSSHRSSLIASFKDKKLIEKHLSFFSMQKGDMIRELAEDDQKIKKLHDYEWFLSNEDKATIISSLKNPNNIIECLKKCNDKIKILTIKYTNNLSEEVIKEILSMIKNPKEISSIMNFDLIPESTKLLFIDRVANPNELAGVIKSLSEYNIIKYLDRIPDKKRIEIITEMEDSNLKLKALKSVEDKAAVVNIIEHNELFPVYNPEYEFIIDLYVEKYKLNKNHLLKIAENMSLYVLKVIENPNITKIINSSEEDFAVIMELFDKNQLAMNSATMNDILNAILQRSFRTNCSNTVLIFPVMLNAIESKSKDTLLEKLNEIAAVLDINAELAKNNWDINQFVEELLAKNQKAIDCLHDITNQYVLKERNNYIQNNLQTTLEKSSITRYDKNELMKYLLANYPQEIVIGYFPMVYSDNESYLSNHFNPQEMELLKNRELIKRIIEFKKNPRLYEQIPEDIKSQIHVFNSIFEKSIANKSMEAFPGVSIDKKNIKYKEPDMEFAIDVLMYMDIDKLRSGLLKDPEMFEKFKKFWSQYKMGGWGTTFEDGLMQTGIIVYPEIIANFIQYFGLSYGSLEEKLEKGELANISITSLIDLAFCYSEESKKYSMVFGSENFKYLASNPGPNAAPKMLKDERIRSAVSLLKTLNDKDHVLVPTSDQDFNLKNGKSINVVVGNTSDISNLTLGERTGSCMRIGGAGSSLFDFCLKNEAGFHIVFNNPTNGNFVSRVSGFRNGNTVFLNELRFSKDANYTNKDVVEACKLIAEQLVEQSKTSSLSIDNVIITPEYSMKESNMPVINTGIEDSRVGMQDFYTDVSATSIILATSKPNNELVPFKPGNKDVPRYKSQRGKQKMLYNEECIEYIAHLQSLDQLLSGKNIEDLSVVPNTNLVACFAGEDWAVMIDKDGNIINYLMENTKDKKRAMEEMQVALMYMKENLEKEMSKSNSISMGM